VLSSCAEDLGAGLVAAFEKAARAIAGRLVAIVGYAIV